MASPVGLSGSLTSGLPQRVFSRLVRTLTTLNDRQIALLAARTSVDERSSYRELGERLGVSAEAVRRSMARINPLLEEALNQLGDVADLLVVTCGQSIQPHRVRSFFRAAGVPMPVEAGAAGASQSDDLDVAADLGITEVASRLLWQKLEASFTKGTDETWFTQEVVARCSELGDLAETLSDPYGVIREAILLDWFPPDLAEDWPVLHPLCSVRRIGEWVITRSGLRGDSDRSGEHLPRRTTSIALALHAVGRPATLDEIEAQMVRLGLDHEFRVVAAMSKMKEIVRAGKSTWGFVQWVDEVYEGIPTAIEKRIARGGGRANLNDVAAELAAKFGVTASSVRIFANTDRYEVLDGEVRMADLSELRFAPLVDVVDGHLADGTPYWCFTVEEPNFRGYSLHSVPPAVARRLGCEADSRLLANVRSPAGADAVSVIWRTNSINGPEIGRIADALQRLCATEGDEVAVVLHGRSQVSLALRRDLAPPADQTPAD